MLSPQKPIRRAYEQNPAKIAQWHEHDYPLLVERAAFEKARIYWTDEVGLRSDHSIGRSYAPVGCTPVVRGAGKRFSTNAISFIDNRGAMCYGVFGGTMAGPVFIRFLDRFIRYAAPEKALLVLDSHTAHTAKLTKAWVRSRAARLEIIFLPGYYPEGNPVEMLNNDIKTSALSRRPRSEDEMNCLLRAWLRSRQRQPSIVRNYFELEQVRYARA